MIDEWIDFGESKLMNSQDMMNNVTLLKILDLIHINEDTSFVSFLGLHLQIYYFVLDTTNIIHSLTLQFRPLRLHPPPYPIP